MAYVLATTPVIGPDGLQVRLQSPVADSRGSPVVPTLFAVFLKLLGIRLVQTSWCWLHFLGQRRD